MPTTIAATLAHTAGAMRNAGRSQPVSRSSGLMSRPAIHAQRAKT